MPFQHCIVSEMGVCEVTVILLGRLCLSALVFLQMRTKLKYVSVKMTQLQR